MGVLGKELEVAAQKRVLKKTSVICVAGLSDGRMEPERRTGESATPRTAALAEQRTLPQRRAVTPRCSLMFRFEEQGERSHAGYRID